MTSGPDSESLRTIRISSLLPEVFKGMEKDGSIVGSQVWLHDITFARGEKVLVKAESGKGKSSLLSFIYGRRTDYTGTIYFDDIDIRSLSVGKWCALRSFSLAWMPQEMALFDELTAKENVLLKNQLASFRSQSWIEHAFRSLGIFDRIDTPVRLLSVGQQQRVAVIRALCQPADFILLDEPVSHLDYETNKKVSSLILDTIKETGAGLIATSVGNNLSIDFDKEIVL